MTPPPSGVRWIASLGAVGTRALGTLRTGDSSAAISSWVFLRGLGVVYLVAFASLRTQILGLIGHDGILPAREFLDAVAHQLGPERYWLAPTVCWWQAGDGFLQGVCGAGTVAAILLILDVAPAACLAVLWASYLSLATVGREFLWFQWDSLLLEAGFLAIWLAPLRVRPRPAQDPPPSRLVVWLLRWLLFRLVFSSGAVKLASGDPTWRQLTALTYHYETQPLPTWIGWYAHQLPARVHAWSCGAMLVIELIIPWLIFAPRRGRRLACAGMVFLQALIAATGNYTFFNLLTIALCVLLLDDGAWPCWWKEVWQRAQARTGRAASHCWPTWMTVPVGGFLLALTAVPMAGLAGARTPLTSLYGELSAFRFVNSYGLFAVMTTVRHEIVVEGSDDGTEWRAYEFTDKPGDLRRRPRFIAPHQPRLDWQMWFAALGSVRQNPWFLRLCERLLEGSPAVLALLARNPFPASPPRYLRCLLYDYRFTEAAARRADGAWWRRELRGRYCPTLSRH